MRRTKRSPSRFLLNELGTVLVADVTQKLTEEGSQCAGKTIRALTGGLAKVVDLGPAILVQKDTCWFTNVGQ